MFNHECSILVKYMVNQACLCQPIIWRMAAKSLRRPRRRAYAHTSNTASHGNHMRKSTHGVSFSFPYEYGASLGRRSSAIKKNHCADF